MQMAHETSPPKGLPGLVPIEPGDAKVFLAAAQTGGAKCWFYYFPRLYFYGKTKGRDLLWEDCGGSILVYEARQNKGNVRLNLYLPPFPFSPEALRWARDRMRDFNGDRAGRVIFVQEADALRLVREGFEIAFKEEEYIYDRAAVMALEGSGFKRLRQELSGAHKAGQLETRPYRAEDEPACLALVEDWRQRLVAGGMRATPYRHTVACLADADRFDISLLNGMVVEVDGVVRGFAFSGRLSNTMGCNYLCVTDHRFRGLAYLLRHRLMAEFPDCSHFNDSSDSGRPGLAALKWRFRPVEMHNLYNARDR